MGDLRDRLARTPGVGPLAGDAALSVLTEGIEIVTPHREGCEGRWKLVGKRTLRCFGWGVPSCNAEARIPEALLVELVEAKGGS